jgi:putative oxidoreductase
VPFPALSATFAGTVELVGGVLLIVGVATALVGVLMVLEMTGAAVATHQYHAVLAQNHGFALTGSVLAGALLIACFGAGRFSVDHALKRRSRTEQLAGAGGPALAPGQDVQRKDRPG